MIDVHCHLNFHSFEKDYNEVIQKSKADGVEIVINVGTKVESSARAVELAQQYENLYAIIGVHPHHADKLEDDWVKKLEELTENSQRPYEKLPRHQREDARSVEDGQEIRNSSTSQPLLDPLLLGEEISAMTVQTVSKIVAIGEIGLDYFSYQSNGIVNPKAQTSVFEQQLVLANKLKLPIQIHGRHAGKEILEILKHHKNLLQPIPGMFHCFAGTLDTLKAALHMGFYIGFDGNITYPGLAPGETVSLADLAAYTPLDRIVTETDSPFLTPIPYRGTRNTPSYVIIVGETISKIKNVSFEEVKEQTITNAKTLFRLS